MQKLLHNITIKYKIKYMMIVSLLRHNTPFCVYKHNKVFLIVVLHGLVVRIPGFHPGGPGSIPGVGIFLVDWNFS